jgi:hypothetical protein
MASIELFAWGAFMCLWSRRQFLTGALGLATASQLGVEPAHAQSSLPEHCALMGYNIRTAQTMSSSGDSRLDRALIAELRRIVDIIPVGPGFKYIRDDAPNAFATSATYVPGTRGTCLFGINLIGREMGSSEYGGVAVAGIAAHECAHIFQYFSPYYGRLKGATAKHVELHADFLAGYYMGRRRQFASDRIAVFARSLFNMGDYDYNNPRHHGTPEQRFEAMKRGYEIGSQNAAFQNAAEEGASFVRRL